MNPLELIEKLINEHGSAQILRERLEALKAQTAELERARSQADAAAKQLKADLDKAHTELKQAQAELVRLRSGPLATHVCDHCGGGQLKRIGTRPSPGPFGQMGLREATLRCEECQGVSYIELPLG